MFDIVNRRAFADKGDSDRIFRICCRSTDLHTPPHQGPDLVLGFTVVIRAKLTRHRYRHQNHSPTFYRLFQWKTGAKRRDIAQSSDLVPTDCLFNADLDAYRQREGDALDTS